MWPPQAAQSCQASCVAASSRSELPRAAARRRESRASLMVVGDGPEPPRVAQSCHEPLPAAASLFMLIPVDDGKREPPGAAASTRSRREPPEAAAGHPRLR